jgi:phospholipase/carboxylesterase
VGPGLTTLIGFSQGAIMALESTQRPEPTSIAARVIALAGRFAQPPRRTPLDTVLHLMHGVQDVVMPMGLAVDADRDLKSLGAASTLDRFAGLGHSINTSVVETILRRLGPSTSIGNNSL